MNGSSPKKRKTDGKPLAATRRSVARLSAVQALYQIEITQSDPETVLREFLKHRLERPGGGGEEEIPLADPDAELFTDLVRGVSARREDLDGMITAALTKDWTVDRLESVLRAALRSGAYELLARPDVPARVIISEYVDIAHAFFSGPEPGLVNGVLDRIARPLRPGELSGAQEGP